MISNFVEKICFVYFVVGIRYDIKLLIHDKYGMLVVLYTITMTANMTYM